MNTAHRARALAPNAQVNYDEKAMGSAGRCRRWYVLIALVALAIASFWLQADFWFGGGFHDEMQALAQATGSEFDLSNPRIPTDQIRAGGPPKDGIPALTNPAVVPAAQANYLKAGDRVIGFSHGEHARAYRLDVLVVVRLV